jgi:hypothetical protein
MRAQVEVRGGCRRSRAKPFEKSPSHRASCRLMLCQCVTSPVALKQALVLWLQGNAMHR